MSWNAFLGMTFSKLYHFCIIMWSFISVVLLSYVHMLINMFRYSSKIHMNTISIYLLIYSELY